MPSYVVKPGVISGVVLYIIFIGCNGMLAMEGIRFLMFLVH